MKKLIVTLKNNFKKIAATLIIVSLAALSFYLYNYYKVKIVSEETLNAYHTLVTYSNGYVDVRRDSTGQMLKLKRIKSIKFFEYSSWAEDSPDKEFEDSLSIFERNGLYGIINLNSGKEILNNEFVKISGFSKYDFHKECCITKNFSPVYKKIKNKTYLGYINRNGQFVVPCKFPVNNDKNYLSDFKAIDDSLFVVSSSSGKIGVVNSKLLLKLDTVFNSIETAYNSLGNTIDGFYLLGIAKKRGSELFGLADKNLNIIKPCAFQKINFTDEGIVLLDTNNNQYLVDYDNYTIKRKTLFDNIEPVYLEIAINKIENKYSYDDDEDAEVDVEVKLIETPYVTYQVGEKYGLLKNGIAITKPIYENIKLLKKQNSDFVFKAEIFNYDEGSYYVLLNGSGKEIQINY